MHQGSCLCGKVKYQLLSNPKKVTSCHCNMCQKQHGAAFATYGNIPKSDLVYVAGAEYLKAYNSSGAIERKFCGECGSSIEWVGSTKFPDWTSVTLSTLDTVFSPEEVTDIYTENMVFWLQCS